jgi:2-amino-4-hydroxy-6-hydroxymethyldihydropteridine diphosphokinase
MGANLGDRAATLKSALSLLSTHPKIRNIATSSVYETQPVGGVPQPLFLNLVVGLETAMTPESLLALLLEIELKYGRVRRERNGPRTLDLDLLAFENEKRNTAELTLPHPRMLERAFVLVPLRELLHRESFSSTAWKTLRDEISRETTSEGVRFVSLSL